MDSLTQKKHEWIPSQCQEPITLSKYQTLIQKYEMILDDGSKISTQAKTLDLIHPLHKLDGHQCCRICLPISPMILVFKVIILEPSGLVKIHEQNEENIEKIWVDLSMKASTLSSRHCREKWSNTQWNKAWIITMGVSNSPSMTKIKAKIVKSRRNCRISLVPKAFKENLTDTLYLDMAIPDSISQQTWWSSTSEIGHSKDIFRPGNQLPNQKAPEWMSSTAWSHVHQCQTERKVS